MELHVSVYSRQFESVFQVSDRTQTSSPPKVNENKPAENRFPPMRIVELLLIQTELEHFLSLTSVMRHSGIRILSDEMSRRFDPLFCHSTQLPLSTLVRVYSPTAGRGMILWLPRKCWWYITSYRFVPARITFGLYLKNETMPSHKNLGLVLFRGAHLKKQTDHPTERRNKWITLQDCTSCLEVKQNCPDFSWRSALQTCTEEQHKTENRDYFLLDSEDALERTVFLLKLTCRHCSRSASCWMVQKWGNAKCQTHSWWHLPEAI